jgi:hypothetical protein
LAVAAAAALSSSNLIRKRERHYDPIKLQAMQPLFSDGLVRYKYSLSIFGLLSFFFQKPEWSFIYGWDSGISVNPAPRSLSKWSPNVIGWKTGGQDISLG